MLYSVPSNSLTSFPNLAHILYSQFKMHLYTLHQNFFTTSIRDLQWSILLLVNVIYIISDTTQA
jgi:hypothetical protein